MINQKKRSSVFADIIWKLEFYITKPRMIWLSFLSAFYYPIRNYEIDVRHKFGNKGRRQIRSTYWELRDPFKIKVWIQTVHKFCPSCSKLDTDKDLEHATLGRFYERYLWSSKFEYKYTRGECEDLIFEPLETWYGSGGDEGSPLFTRGDAYWYYKKPMQYISRKEARCL